MATKQQLRTRIASVKTTGKITKAMQLVATAKLKRVGKRIQAVQPYYSEVYTTFNRLLSTVQRSIYLTTPDFKPKKTLWIIINSNLGLCGGYNSNINKLAVPKIIQHQDQIIAIGSKAESFYKSRHYKLFQVYKNFDIDVNYSDVDEIAANMVQLFNNQEFDCIKMAYTKFINNLTFEPTVIQLLPLFKKAKTTKQETHAAAVAEFEPDAATILEAGLPLYISALFYGALIESQVSEQASRRMSMESASDNASDLLQNLTLQYNRARQAAITQELIEIIAGANTDNEEV